MGLDPQTIFSEFNLHPLQRLLIAVSGGSDSLGLLVLAAQHFARDRLVAVTVDHALRPQSAQEAREVGAYCAAIGVRHRIATWTGDKPQSGLIAAAREARYELLAGVAEAEGADVVLVAHTADDQAETVAMRAQRRNEGAGLAGMAQATLFDGRFWLLRPLLAYRREAIRDHLRGQGIAWIDDPSNENRAYERVRTRFALTEAERTDLAASAIAQADTRSQASRAAAALVENLATQPARGLVRLDRTLRDANRETAVLALRALLATMGGVSYLPDERRVGTMFSNLHDGMRATLSRVVVDVRRSGIWLRREARDLPVLPLAGRPVVWDGRWTLNGGARAGLEVRPLGPADAAPVQSGNPDVPESLVRAALAGEPGIFLHDVCRGLAQDVPGVSALPRVAPYARFLSCFDLELANALARLIGAPSFAEPPWKQHNTPGP